MTLAMTNVGQANFWWNLKCSLTAVGVANDVLIGADEEACAVASRSPNTRCVVPTWLFNTYSSSGEPSSALNGHADYGSLRFIQLQRMKTRPVLEALRLGYHVLYTDLDIYWMADPRFWLLGRAALEQSWQDAARPYTRGLDGGNLSVATDLLIQSDFVPWNARACKKGGDCKKSSRCGVGGVCAPEANAGFYFLRSSDASQSFIQELQRVYGLRSTPADVTEQPIFNKVPLLRHVCPRLVQPTSCHPRAVPSTPLPHRFLPRRVAICAGSSSRSSSLPTAGRTAGGASGHHSAPRRSSPIIIGCQVARTSGGEWEIGGCGHSRTMATARTSPRAAASTRLSRPRGAGPPSESGGESARLGMPEGIRNS